MLTYTLIALGALAAGITARTFRVVNEYERGVKFTFGQFEAVMPPGIRTVIPLVQSWERVDMRVKAVDVPQQESITRDNVTVSINAVIYYKVRDAKKAIIEVEQYMPCSSYATCAADRSGDRPVRDRGRPIARHDDAHPMRRGRCQRAFIGRASTRSKLRFDFESFWLEIEIEEIERHIVSRSAEAVTSAR